jgi:hypothetical protein
MKVFLLTILIGIIFLSSFVFVMDPGYRWHDAPAPFSRALNDNEIRIFPTNFDERSVKVSHIKFIQKPDLLLLGSSRVAPVSSVFFSKDVNIFNAGLSSASIEDYIGIWQDLKQQGKNPSKVIIFMDPWLFNTTANKMATGWHFIGSYVDTFYSEHGYKAGVEESKPNFKAKLTFRERIIKTINSAYRLPDRLSQGFDLAFQVMSWPMVKASSKIFLKNGISRDRIINRIVTRKEFGPEDRGVAKDGATLYPLSETQSKTPEALEVLVKEYVTKPNSFDDWHFDHDAQTKFNLLINDISRNGAEVLLISPPFHPLMTELMTKKVNYPSFLAEAQAAVKASTSKSAKINFCNAEDFHAVGCLESEMKDSTHLLEPCITKVLRFCTQNSPWSKVL